MRWLVPPEKAEMKKFAIEYADREALTRLLNIPIGQHYTIETLELGEVEVYRDCRLIAVTPMPFGVGYSGLVSFKFEWGEAEALADTHAEWVALNG
jgi:hypothetical protein